MTRMLFILVFFPATLFAATDAGTGGIFISSLKIFGTLAIIIGIIFLLYYLSKKGINLLPTPRAGIIKVVEIKHLMPKKSLCLVEVRGQEMLLGIGLDRIELLSYISADGKKDSFQENLDSSTPLPGQ